jgi:hypothetical protein
LDVTDQPIRAKQCECKRVVRRTRLRSGLRLPAPGFGVAAEGGGEGSCTLTAGDAQEKHTEEGNKGTNRQSASGIVKTWTL